MGEKNKRVSSGGGRALEARERIDAALRRMQPARRARSRRNYRRRPVSAKRFAAAVAVFLVTLVLAVAFPFVVWLRLSIVLYADFGINHWVAIACGVAAATVVVMLYVWYLAGKLGVERIVTVSRSRAVIVLVGAFTIWSLLFISAANVKSPDVRTTYRETHPLLRMSLAALVVFDRRAVVTDMRRETAEYRRMGLPVNERSLHLRQKDGYVHAVDLRTIGRNELHNYLVASYFRAIGLRTIRHVGTADHLHVSLPVPE